MNDLTTTKRSSPLSLVVRGATRGVLWGPRKIVKAMKALKEAASNFFERARLAVQRRPSQAVRVQPTLKLADKSAPKDPLTLLKGFLESIPGSKNLQETHDSFLQNHGHHFTPGEVNRLTNTIQHPKSYADAVGRLIDSRERNQPL